MLQHGLGLAVDETVEMGLECLLASELPWGHALHRIKPFASSPTTFLLFFLIRRVENMLQINLGRLMEIR